MGVGSGRRGGVRHGLTCGGPCGWWMNPMKSMTLSGSLRGLTTFSSTTERLYTGIQGQSTYLSVTTHASTTGEWSSHVGAPSASSAVLTGAVRLFWQHCHARIS